MAGSIKWQEGTLLTLESSGAAATAGSAVLATTKLDCRTLGNAADLLAVTFSLSAAVAANTGITGNVTTMADLYLVPSLDGGTNYADVDTTAGAGVIPFPMRKGVFVFPKTPTAGTNILFQSGECELYPVIYNVYLINRSGQTMNAGWVLKALPAAMQYT
jgi:hypothetical protein